MPEYSLVEIHSVLGEIKKIKVGITGKNISNIIAGHLSILLTKGEMDSISIISLIAVMVFNS